MRFFRAGALVCAVTGLLAASSAEGPLLKIEFNGQLHSRIVAKFGRPVPIGNFAPSEFVRVGGRDVHDFAAGNAKQEAVRDKLGSGRRSILSGTNASLKKTVTVTVYPDFPGMAFFDVEYANIGSSEISVESWTNNRYVISASPAVAPDAPVFWSYQSGSYKNRPDWIVPLKPGFQQSNFLGMNSSDYGGGTPVVDVWRKDLGIGVGHIELAPKLVSLPVMQPDAQSATVGVTYQLNRTLKPGGVLRTFRTFVSVHQGDYFPTLAGYRKVMERQGIQLNPSHESAFEPIWCAWGYGRNYTPEQVYGALPAAKKLGFKWVGLDDGWQTNEGDWALEPMKHPNGDRDMKAFVDKVHSEGFRAQLWWAPLAVDEESNLLRQHPEQVLLNADGSKQRITYWNSWYLCPADPAVVDYHRNLVVKMIRDWGYDGLKLDGQYMNGVPPCYNRAHKHLRSEESVEALPKFFKMIYDTARSIKPDALVEWCPCGTAFSFFTLPYLTMSVASDPRGSFQVRSKGKTLKALHGDGIAYFGDHVELSTGRDDFASTVGIGGVIGSEFTWPPGSSPKDRNALTPEKEAHFAKWMKIYKDKMLSRGEYVGTLYDIGFDKPEAHVVRKAQTMYYAFYAPEWNGKIELRGLAKRAYRVTDYVNGRDLGVVQGPAASLDVAFQKHLLVETTPQ